MIGLLFLAIPLIAAVWLWVFWPLAKPTDARPPLPSRREREREQTLLLVARFNEAMRAVVPAFRNMGEAFQRMQPAMARIATILKEVGDD